MDNFHRDIAFLLCAVLALSVTACGNVTQPPVYEYRLAWPARSDSVPPVSRLGVLRIGEIQVAAALEGDRLRVASGPVRFQSFESHRWAAPLDRMVADVLAAGLSRSRRFVSVLTAADEGREDFVLSGRVLEMEQAALGDAWGGVASVELRLRESATGRTLFEQEFRSIHALRGEGPEELVAALSAAMGEVISEVASRCVADVSQADTLAAPR